MTDTQKTLHRIIPANVQGAEYAYTAHFAVLPHGATIDDAAESEFWAHVASTFKPRDTIEVIAEDGTFEAKFRVLDTGKGWAKVRLISRVDEYGINGIQFSTGGDEKSSAETISIDDFEIKWGGGAKNRIHRKSDGTVLKDGFATKEGAAEWLSDHIRKIKA